jgi:hypothetical protein
VSAFYLIPAGRRIRQMKEKFMKDQGMPLGDFRFCFRYEPCSQELKARMAALDSVTGAQIRSNLARAIRKASPAQSVIFPTIIDRPLLTSIRSSLIQELMLYFLPPDVVDYQCGSIHIVGKRVSGII